MRVVHVGCYPPPYGGVASHVQRLDRLCRERGIASMVVDCSGVPKQAGAGVDVITLCGSRFARFRRLMRELRSREADVVHFHVSGMKNFIWISVPLMLTTRSRKYIVSLHGGSFVSRWGAWPSPVRRLAEWALSQCDRLIAANHDQRNFLVDRAGFAPGKVVVVPPFLPLVSNGAGPETLPPGLAEFCSCYRGVALITGYPEPLYGFHTAVEALDLLADRSLGLVIHFYSDGDERYKRGIHEMVRARHNVYIVDDVDDAQMAGILSCATVFVRATSADGDSLALREAAHFKSQIIATDCVVRPQGCLLFRYGDAPALAACISAALADPSAGVVHSNDCDHGARIVELYKEVLGA